MRMFRFLLFLPTYLCCSDFANHPRMAFQCPRMQMPAAGRTGSGVHRKYGTDKGQAAIDAGNGGSTGGRKKPVRRKAAVPLDHNSKPGTGQVVSFLLYGFVGILLPISNL